LIKPRRMSLLVAAGAGYVLGARAGRERYEQIAATASRIKGNPKVQAAASKAQDTVTQQAPVVASAVKDKVTDTFGKDDHEPTHAAPAGPAVS
jgi:hypothetical protein